jgi:hypothetical protein
MSSPKKYPGQRPSYGSALIRGLLGEFLRMPASDVLLIGLLAQNVYLGELKLKPSRMRILQAHAQSLKAALSWIKWAELGSNSKRQVARHIKKHGAALTNMAFGKFEMANEELISRHPQLKEETNSSMKDMGQVATTLSPYLPHDKKRVENTPVSLTIQAFLRLENKLRDQGMVEAADKVALLLIEYRKAIGLPESPNGPAR